MTEHTPGPWNRKGTFVYALEDCIFGGAPSTHNRFFFQVYGQGAPQSELEAVARLCEVAPDMYAALEDLLEAATKENIGPAIFALRVHFARETLARAQGLIA